MDGLSLLELMEKQKPVWRKFIDMEHATAYWRENYWCALTDGKIKYIRFLTTGKEQLFDLEKDPEELRELSSDKSYQKKLLKMRQEMVTHLSERGEEWVKDGQIVLKPQSLLYSPNYPRK